MLRRVIGAVVFAVGVGSCAPMSTESAPEAPQNRPRVPANWSIGIVGGADVMRLKPLPGCANPRVTKEMIPDGIADFVADPFLVRHNDRWFLFFELFNRKTKRGEIAVAASVDLCSWSYSGIVLAEPFHLSFPFVFRVGATYYMMPESRQSGAIRLYSTSSFPSGWRLEREIVRGNYSDPTPVFFHNRWWIFANRSPYALAIFSASGLDEDFVEHPQSPLYEGDFGRARPAGRPVVLKKRLIRFVQDNREGYGKRVRAVQVTKLTPSAFAEQVLAPDPLLQGGVDRWNSEGMHHISPLQLRDGSWVAAVDGNAK